jgi:hypothetical protein
VTGDRPERQRPRHPAAVEARHEGPQAVHGQADEQTAAGAAGDGHRQARKPRRRPLPADALGRAPLAGGRTTKPSTPTSRRGNANAPSRTPARSAEPNDSCLHQADLLNRQRATRGQPVATRHHGTRGAPTVPESSPGSPKRSTAHRCTFWGMSYDGSSPNVWVLPPPIRGGRRRRSSRAFRADRPPERSVTRPRHSSRIPSTPRSTERNGRPTQADPSRDTH